MSSSLYRQGLFHDLLESQLLQHRRHRQQAAVSGQILTFEVVRRRSPNFIGLPANFSSPLPGAAFLAMLLTAVHHLGDLRDWIYPELALREIRFLSRFIGVTKWFFASDSPQFKPSVHNSGDMNNRPCAVQ